MSRVNRSSFKHCHDTSVVQRPGRTVINVSCVIRICVIYPVTRICLRYSSLDLDLSAVPANVYTSSIHTRTSSTYRFWIQQLNSLWRNNHPLQVFIVSKYLKSNPCFRTISNDNAAVFWTDPSQARHGAWRDIVLRLVAIKPQRILLAPDLDSMKAVERISEDSC